jgi:hypothetical protein
MGAIPRIRQPIKQVPLLFVTGRLTRWTRMTRANTEALSEKVVYVAQKKLRGA